MVKVNELRDGQKFQYLKLEVLEKGSGQEFTSKATGNPFTVAKCRGKDETGEINFSAWNDQINLFEIGDSVEFIDGLVNTYKDELQVTSGRFGQFKAIKKNDNHE